MGFVVWIQTLIVNSCCKNIIFCLHTDKGQRILAMESLSRDDLRTEVLVQSFALQVSDMCLWGRGRERIPCFCAAIPRGLRLPLWGVLGVILCCASLPQSQGDSSKNSVVSSSSTKDSSMSSAAPMVHHPRLVLITLSHHFHLFTSVPSLLSLCFVTSCLVNIPCTLAALTTFTVSVFASDLTV